MILLAARLAMRLALEVPELRQAMVELGGMDKSEGAWGNGTLEGLRVGCSCEKKR